jgi:hypothetical protein
MEIGSRALGLSEPQTLGDLFYRPAQARQFLRHDPVGLGSSRFQPGPAGVVFPHLCLHLFEALLPGSWAFVGWPEVSASGACSNQRGATDQAPTRKRRKG